VFRNLSERLNWRAVIWGWAVAIVTGVVVNIVFEGAHVLLFGGEALSTENFTTAVVAISLVSGFLAHFAGGYVAGRRANFNGGLAVISAIAVATAGIFLIEGGIPFPSVTLGFAGGALLASLALLLLNIIGGFFGGKLGEWERGPVGSSGGATRTPSE
jgi:hypothetical protein